MVVSTWWCKDDVLRREAHCVGEESRRSSWDIGLCRGIGGIYARDSEDSMVGVCGGQYVVCRGDSAGGIGVSGRRQRRFVLRRFFLRMRFVCFCLLESLKFRFAIGFHRTNAEQQSMRPQNLFSSIVMFG